MQKEDIISILPYGEEFCFVDSIISVDQDSISGEYTFRQDEGFYASHFKNNPVTPGVILLECMGQIGLVSHGIYLLGLEADKYTAYFTHAETEFFRSVKPGEKILITAIKKFLRRNNLRSDIEMKDPINGEIIARANAMCTFKINPDNE